MRMLPKLKFTLAGAGMIVLTGCAGYSVEDFAAEDTVSRAEIICHERDDIENLASEYQNGERQIAGQQALVTRGYRTHRQCRMEKYAVGQQDCGGSTGTDLQMCNLVNSSGQGSKQVCTDTVIPIDYQFESQKLANLEANNGMVAQDWSDKFEGCVASNKNLSASEGYRRYEQYGG